MRLTLWWLAVIMLVLAGCQASPTTAPAFTGGPRLSVEPAVLDLGQVATASPVEAAVALRNIGDAPLRIERAYTRVVEGCCPPQPRLERRVIPPGETERMSFRVVMSPGMTGPHRFEVVIESNDAVSPRLTLSIRADFVER